MGIKENNSKCAGKHLTDEAHEKMESDVLTICIDSLNEVKRTLDTGNYCHGEFEGILYSVAISFLYSSLKYLEGAGFEWEKLENYLKEEMADWRQKKKGTTLNQQPRGKKASKEARGIWTHQGSSILPRREKVTQ